MSLTIDTPGNPLLSGIAVGGVLLCLSALAIAYFYMEKHLLLEACPLCILDRFAVGGMAITFALTAWSWRRRISRLGWIAWGTGLFLLLNGFLFVGRHIWLQSLPPDESGFCLGANEQTQNLIELIGKAFGATADCGGVAWTFAGLSIPQQVLILLIVLLAIKLTLAWLAWQTRARENP